MCARKKPKSHGNKIQKLRKFIFEYVIKRGEWKQNPYGSILVKLKLRRFRFQETRWVIFPISGFCFRDFQ